MSTLVHETCLEWKAPPKGHSLPSVCCELDGSADGAVCWQHQDFNFGQPGQL